MNTLDVMKPDEIRWFIDRRAYSAEMLNHLLAVELGREPSYPLTDALREQRNAIGYRLRSVVEKRLAPHVHEMLAALAADIDSEFRGPQ